MDNGTQIERGVNPVIRTRLINHAIFTRHWFNAAGTNAYASGLNGDELKRIVGYRRDFHKMLLPGSDGTAIGIVDSLCETEFKRKPRELKEGEHYCGLCDIPVSRDGWNEHRLTPTHSAIELDVQMIYTLWRHIEEVKRRRYERKDAPDSIIS